MSMSNHEISVAADKAADYIEEHGHTKNELQDCGGSVCIRGAMLMAITGSAFSFSVTPMDLSVGHAVVDYLGLPERYSVWHQDEELIACEKLDRVVYWNNEDERTQEEVVEVLRNVATKYRSDEMRQNG